VIDATSAKAAALKHGLLLLERMGCSPTIVESDSLVLINNCNSETEIMGPHAAILTECFQNAHRISNISFIHCPREVNKVAHNLARLSFNFISFYCLGCYCPML
jgi:hypothetical protein